MLRDENRYDIKLFTCDREDEHTTMDGSNSVLTTFDETGVQKFHWRTVITTGMGFFTDAYDLFIIGTVTAILTPLWHLSTGQLAILNSTSLAAAAVGALVCGRLMDRLGRKTM